MNGKRAKAIKKQVFEDMRYAPHEIAKKPTHLLRGTEVNKKTLYRTPKFKEIYRAAKKNFLRNKRTPVVTN